MIHGAFPRQSISTHTDKYSTNSNYSSNSSSSSSSGSDNYSIPSTKSTPHQRVHRKPVSNNRIARESPMINNEWKTSSPVQQRSYHAPAVDTHPRIVSPLVKDTLSSSVPLPRPSNTPQSHVRTRCQSQGLAKPTFWYPRVEAEPPLLEPLKRGLSKKIRGLLQPNRAQIEQGGTQQQYEQDCQEALHRCRTPNDIGANPFQLLSYQNESSSATFDYDFTQIDHYASAVQQRGPLLTPVLLSQKFLVRPYKRDLFRLRALFIWLVQNIRPLYHHNHHQQQQQHPAILIKPTPSKSSNIRQRLSRLVDEEELITEGIEQDTMNLLQETSHIMLLADTSYESAEEVLEKRSCQSSLGMATLFAVMAEAAGFESKVIGGYLKAPKDTIESGTTSINHAWCSVKIEGEDRLIDCWLASPFHPHNENKMEAHWFLTRPQDMIMTHLPKSSHYQYLNSPLNQHAFFSLPYVRNPFFWHSLRMLHYKNQIAEEGGVFYFCLQLEENISCYAETEAEDGTVVRGLAQCITEKRYRVCKIKAVLPPHQRRGWLKIYAGPKVVPAQSSHGLPEIVQKNHYPLAMCIYLQGQPVEEKALDFVQLYSDHNEFFIQEPQCYRLFPLQTYHFCIRGNRTSATHHKLAIKSPGGKLVKLMYYPQDQTYDGKVTVSETGKWSLICLLHHTGGWYTVASWSCVVK
ncbi:uncharacterized protein EV154DRAFT_473389 [Mucor mucedo]|uniref:uncharacterized protein n=1 Tax=Mucor mucedo TaxID=29922 RepID=UPI00221F005C|nr:uncharacterized protein EV154DRAFT_473389 [Mucor mucedo]KAI7873470.1 hypothetical protein EV154DRAFT_473389 [Mucor mucedo]